MKVLKYLIKHFSLNKRKFKNYGLLFICVFFHFVCLIFTHMSNFTTWYLEIALISYIFLIIFAFRLINREEKRFIEPVAAAINMNTMIIIICIGLYLCFNIVRISLNEFSEFVSVVMVFELLPLVLTTCYLTDELDELDGRIWI